MRNEFRFNFTSEENIIYSSWIRLKDLDALELISKLRGQYTNFGYERRQASDKKSMANKSSRNK